MFRLVPLPLFLLALLTACGEPDAALPAVSIASPAVG